jgi:hypothetical protein
MPGRPVQRLLNATFRALLFGDVAEGVVGLKMSSSPKRWATSLPD